MYKAAIKSSLVLRKYNLKSRNEIKEKNETPSLLRNKGYPLYRESSPECQPRLYPPQVGHFQHIGYKAQELLNNAINKAQRNLGGKHYD